MVSWHPGCEKMDRELRKWRGNGERLRKWRENEEMGRDSLSTFSHFLYLFPLSKVVSFWRKMLNTALLSWISQKKTYHMHYEKIILGRIYCEKAPQVLQAWYLYCISMRIKLRSSDTSIQGGGQLKKTPCICGMISNFATNLKYENRMKLVRPPFLPPPPHHLH